MTASAINLWSLCIIWGIKPCSTTKQSTSNKALHPDLSACVRNDIHGKANRNIYCIIFRVTFTSIVAHTFSPHCLYKYYNLTQAYLYIAQISNSTSSQKKIKNKIPCKWGHPSKVIFKFLWVTGPRRLSKISAVLSYRRVF